MKIVMENFYFEGHHIKRYECELPQVKEFDEAVQERIIDYIVENLKSLTEEP